jgi:hypothetical protein
MKKIKNILLASILTMSAFTATIMTSCNPDACQDVICSNGGTCTDGACSCPSGYEGASCDTRTITKYLGSYVGNGTDDNGGVYTSWKLVIAQTDTTSTTNATFVLLNSSNVQQLSFTGTISSNGIISLDNKTTTNFLYTNGTGSVAVGSYANLTFKESDNPGGTNPYVYTFNNMVKQ